MSLYQENSMKHVILVIVAYVGMYFGLPASVSPSLVQEMSTLGTGYAAAPVEIFSSNMTIQDSLAQHKREELPVQPLTVPPQCQHVQSLYTPSDAIAQAMGLTCLTPAGRCSLRDPLPINSSCCCPNACGYVAR